MISRQHSEVNRRGPDATVIPPAPHGPRLNQRPFVSFALAITVSCLSACKSAPPPPPPPPAPAKTLLTLQTHDDVNPDMNGRPSPVVIRVYQLKSDTAFARAEFFALFDDDRKVLGAEMLDREEYELAPGEQRTLELTGPPEAHFIGAIAAFQGIRIATWRALAPVDNTPGRPTTSLTVVAEKQTVRIEAGH